METWVDIIILIFILEVLVILLLIVTIPVHRVFLYFKKRRDDKARSKISEIINGSLRLSIRLKDSSITSLKRYEGSANLLKILEEYGLRIKGGDFEKLKNQITAHYLLPSARKKAFSSSWVKRNFAARCFVLTPLHEDEKIINKLLCDPVFLVQSIAAIACIELGEKRNILEIINKMSKEEGYSDYYYRDILLQSPSVFPMIQEIAEKEKDPGVHLICLELLANMTIVHLPQYLKEDLDSKDAKVRRLAVKIIAQNPNAGSIEILTKCLNDQDPKVRAEAVLGLHYFPNEAVFNTLQEALKDPVWQVRLNAAEMLKQMGEKGKKVLENQNVNSNKDAYEVAQTVLLHDW